MRKIFPESEGKDVIFPEGQLQNIEEQIDSINAKDLEQDAAITNLQNKTQYNGLTEVTSETVTAGILNSTSIVNTGNIGTDEIEANNAEFHSAEIEEAHLDNAYIGSANVNDLTVENLNVLGSHSIDEINITDTGITNATINNAEVDTADITSLSSDAANVKNLGVTVKATIEDADITTLDVTSAEAGSLTADSVDTDALTSDEANIPSLKAESIMNKEIVHSDFYMNLTDILDNNDYYWVKIPSFKSGSYTITLIGTSASLGAGVDEPMLSLTVSNSFDNISFKYSKYKISILDDVLIKDDDLYIKIHDNGKLYYSWNVLDTVLPPASYLNNCPIDPATAEYSITLTSKYGDIYTHYVYAQNLNEGGGSAAVTNLPLTLSAADDIANANPTGNTTVEYNGEAAEAASIYVPDQNVNTTSDVTFNDVTANSLATVEDELTVRKDRNTAVVGVAGVTVENYDGNDNDITFGVDSNGDLCVGDTTFSKTEFVERTQIDGTHPTGTTKAYVERKTAGGSEVAQVLVEEDANANESIPLRASDGSLKALMPSTVEDETVVNNEYLEDYVDDLKGAANGIAPLDSSSLLPTTNLPSVPKAKLPEGMMTYKGNDWDASDGFPEDADPSYTPAKGDYWECGTGGTIDGVVYRVGDIIVYTGSEWKKQGGSSGAPLSDNTPYSFPLGYAAPGTANEASRADHMHRMPEFALVNICGTAVGSTDRVVVPYNFADTDYHDPIMSVIKVFFKNGYYVANSTDVPKLTTDSGLNGLPIYVSKDGQIIPMPVHSCTRAESGDSQAHYWAWQANTTLTLMFDRDLNDGNGGWLVLDNPVVLSYTSATQSYTVKANGLNTNLNYTTGESEIDGTWIDGKKIYRRVYTLPQIGGASQGNVETNVTYIDKIISVKLITSANTRFNYPLSARINGTTLQAFAEHGCSAGDLMVLEYTKP